MAKESTSKSSSDEQYLGILNVLLEEFKYRHENFWGILFKFSYVIIILYAAPYFKPENFQDISQLSLGFPVLGFLLSVAGVILLRLEYKILAFVESNYNNVKDEIRSGASNFSVLRHQNIGLFIIYCWGISFGAIGLLEFFLLL